MKRILPALLAAGAVLASSSSEASETRDPGTVAYRWTISASDTNPWENSATVVPGLNTFFLWLESCVLPSVNGISAAEFSLVSTNPANIITAFVNMNQWLNAGDTTNLLLAVGGCPCGPVVAGAISMFVQEPGSLTLGPSAQHRMVGWDCTIPDPESWGIEWVGLGFVWAGAGACCFPDGSCEDGLDPTACLAAGGEFQGQGTTCAQTWCPPDGACCFPDGSCAVLDQTECEFAGGAFQGGGTDCASVTCESFPPVPGACCLPDGSCVSGLSGSECDAAGGVFQGPGTDCADVACHPFDPRPYGWAISASSSRPDVNVVPFEPGTRTFYLWFWCSPDNVQGMAAAELGLVSTRQANPILVFSPMSGFLNAGTMTSLLLVVGGCPSGFLVAGSIVVLVNQPGSLCIGATDAGAMLTVDCDPVQPASHAVDWIGLDFGGGPCFDSLPCQIVVPVENRSWSRIKAMYR